jgi:hypothetical protein
MLRQAALLRHHLLQLPEISTQQAAFLKVDASGLSSGLQVDGYVPGAAFNGFITNNDASAGTASRLSLGRSTASVFGFIQTNNNTEAVEVGTDGAVRLTASKVGDITANTGNLVIGTAGKGIDFSANTHAAGMTSELLNDYEEGTWTPRHSAVSRRAVPCVWRSADG